MTNIDYTKPYVKYASDILSGNIVSGEAMKLACKRFIDWFSRDDMYFDYNDVDMKIAFTRNMKHYQAQFRGKPFILLPWETFIYANVYGWKWTADNLNVTNHVLVTMARKNCKTALCAGMAIIAALSDYGEEVDMIANNVKQASICMNHTLNFAQSLDAKGKYFKRYRDSIKIIPKKSVIQVLSSDSSGLDGLSASVFFF